MYCENHPEREAKVRCLYCWKSICPDCRIPAKERPFCSQRCCTLYLIKNIRLRSQQIFFRHNLYLRAKIDHLSKYSTLFLVLVCFGIGLLLLYSSSTEERHTSLPRISSSPSPTALGGEGSENENLLPKKQEGDSSATPQSTLKENAAEDAASLHSASLEEENGDFHISLAPVHLNNPSYIVDICGDAPSNSIIALYKNGRLCDTIPCKGGRFLFPRVGLKRNKNVLQAKLITADGNFCFSNTLELFFDRETSQVIEKGLDIRRGDVHQKKMCLTFDSGERVGAASLILDILKEKHIQTTIFLTGEFIRKNPKLVSRIVKDGHEIGNHTDTHPHLAKFEGRRFKCLPGVDREFLHRELKKAEGAFYHLTGKHMSPYWRSPYGENNLEIRKWAEELGYVHVSWTCGRVWEDGLDSLDWVANTDSIKYHTAEEIRNQIVNFGKDSEIGANGGIVLMHFSTSRPPEDEVYVQLPKIIDELSKKGYEIVKISQLLPKKGSEPEKADTKLVDKAGGKNSDSTPTRRSFKK